VAAPVCHYKRFTTLVKLVWFVTSVHSGMQLKMTPVSNNLLHRLHLYCLSPASNCIWFTSLLLSENDSIHWSHLNGLTAVCTRTCCFRPPFRENDLYICHICMVCHQCALGHAAQSYSYVHTIYYTAHTCEVYLDLGPQISRVSKRFHTLVTLVWFDIVVCLDMLQQIVRPRKRDTGYTCML
jgi:hypothetical protein